MVGLGVLAAASLAYVLGLELAGAALGLLVAALALLAATTGFCAGCTAYRIGYRVTGRTFVSCPLPPPLPEPALSARPASGDSVATTEPRPASHRAAASSAAMAARAAPATTITSAPGGSTSFTPASVSVAASAIRSARSGSSR